MYSVVAGGGKVGANVARSLLKMGHEVTLIEQRPYRFDQLQDEFEHQESGPHITHGLPRNPR